MTLYYCTTGRIRKIVASIADMNPEERKQERLRIRRDRERQARAQETAEEREVRLAKRREKQRALNIQGKLCSLASTVVGLAA